MFPQTFGKVPDLVVRDLPPFAVALATAEFFFKFGSFALECLAFLALWWALAQGYRRMLGWFGYRQDAGWMTRRPE